MLEVISDRKVRFTDNGTLVYTADVISYSDYSPYGTLLDTRHGNDNTYRYGFQGQERDDEIKGAGNSYNYEYRMHDPRIGRFFACDPLTPKYPYYTPYQFSGNRPIDCVELEGLEPLSTNEELGTSTIALEIPSTNTYYNYTRSSTTDQTWIRGERVYFAASEYNDMSRLSPMKETSTGIDGRTINVPSNATLNYSPTGVLNSFSYDFEGDTRSFSLSLENGKYNGYFYDPSPYTSRDRIKYVDQKFFSNEADAYKYMINNTEWGNWGPEGYKGNYHPNTEQIALITAKGVWVSSNAYNDGGSSAPAFFMTKKDDFYYIFGEKVLAMLHTHPSFGNPSFHSGDIWAASVFKNIIGISMDIEEGLIDGGYWRAGANGYKNFIVPDGMTNKALLDGSKKLIPYLTKYRL